MYLKHDVLTIIQELLLGEEDWGKALSGKIKNGSGSLIFTSLKEKRGSIFQAGKPWKIYPLYLCPLSGSGCRPLLLTDSPEMQIQLWWRNSLNITPWIYVTKMKKSIYSYRRVMRFSSETCQKAVERQKRTEICLSEVEVFLRRSLNLQGAEESWIEEEAAEQKNWKVWRLWSSRALHIHCLGWQW